MPDRALTRLQLVALLLGAAAVYLIGNERVSLWDRDEPRYAQTSKHMVESGNWIVPRFLDVVRTAKPIFIYWCQGGAMKLLGTTAFAARLPSVVAMLITLTILAVVIWRVVDPTYALWTVFILATSALTLAAAKMCLTDSVLLLFITIGQFCLYSIWHGNRSWTTGLLLGVMIGLAGLTKGPVIVGVQLMTLIVLFVLEYGIRREHLRSAFRDFFQWFVSPQGLVTVGMTIAIVLPWILMVERQEPGFIWRSIRHDLIKHTQGSLEGHKGPPGYYLVTVWGTYFPWSVLLPAALVLGWKRRTDPHIHFALAAIIGPWLMFEIVQTKLPHYLLPCFPPLAFITADLLIRSIRGEYTDLKTAGAKVVFGVWAVVVIALGLTPWLAMKTFGPLPWEAMTIVSIAAIIYAMAVFVRFAAGDVARGAVAMGVGMMLVIVIAFTVYFPRADFLRLSPRVARSLVANGATRDNDVIMIDYKEPSLAFYQGGTIRERPDGYLSTIPFDRWPTWTVLTDEAWGTMPAGVKRRLVELESFHGLAYADEGRVVNVKVLQKR